MLPTLPYLFKSILTLGILWGYYRLFLEKQTFHQTNRLYLLLTLIFSCTIPYLHFELTPHQAPEIIHAVTLPLPSLLEEVQVDSMPELSPISPAQVWGYVYGTGILLLAINYLIAAFKITRIITHNRNRKIRGLRIVSVPDHFPVCSFFNILFLNDKQQNQADLREILAHEKIHIQQYHSLDLLLVNISCILNWFNPFMWLLRRTIIQNHEYIADRQAIKNFRTESYLQVLANQALGSNSFLMNHFASSNLKMRINMLNTRNTKRYKLANYVPAIMLGGGLLLSFSFTPMESKTAFVNTEKTTRPVPVTDTTDNEVFSVVEEMPTFPGGQKALITWLQTNLKYPKEAQEKKIQGTVMIQFVVQKDGSIAKPQILRSVDPILDKEALRVISQMPKWTPGKQRGKVVNTRFTLPIVFKIHQEAPEGQSEATKTDSILINEPIPATTDNEVFSVVEEMPTFPGGQKALITWLQTNLKYPKEAQEKKIQGTVMIQFIVQKDGSIVKPEILRSADPILDKEALRLVSLMPKWTSGKQRGKTVNTRFTFPITFKLRR